MEIINLNQFKISSTVLLGESEYTINGISVEQFLNDKDIEALDHPERSVNPKEHIKTIIRVITKISNIPEEIIIKQNIDVLKAIIVVAQGKNPQDLIAAEKEIKQEKNV